MNLTPLFFIAVALSMDAFAVAVTHGMMIHNLRLRHALTIAVFFGTFQGIMPVIGWSIGTKMASYIHSFDHWIAFFLLAGIGIKMIYEASKLEKVPEKIECLNIYVLFLLSVATSLDALALGFSFALLKVMIIFPAILIGIVTFFVSLGGVYIGDKMGHFFERKMEIVGGVILILIGTKILLEGL